MKTEEKSTAQESAGAVVRMRVIVTNGILGNSEQTMTVDEIKDYSVCAYMCAQKVLKHGGKHSMGMWTVEAA